MNNPKVSNQIAGAPPPPSGGDPTVMPAESNYPTHDFEFTYQDNCDGTHPLNLDYFVPINMQRLITARLSVKLRAYRTYNSISVTATGAGTSHAHSQPNSGGEAALHSHNHTHGGHSHSIHIVFNGGAASMNIGGGAVGSNDAAAPVDYNNINATTPAADATASNNHTHIMGSVNGEASHTHPISATIGLGVTEGAVATSVTVLFDGVDQTAALGGPFTVDQVELDVTKYVSKKVDKLWHLVALQPSGLGRVQAILRILYSSNPV